MTIPKSVRWNPSALMGSGCMINIVTGPRSLGKTYAMKKQAIRRFIERGETWAYVRYNDAMVERIITAPEKFLDDVQRNNEFPNHILRMEGRRMQIARKCEKLRFQDFGSIYSLTSFDSYKGTTTPNMTLLVIDEFIKEKEKRNVPYPPGVVNAFFNLWETFDRRENRVKCVFLANSADIVNPFFRAWKIKPIPKGTSRFFPMGHARIYYENAWSAEFEKFSRDTVIGAYTEGTDYDAYAVGNEFVNSSDMFIAKRPKTAFCQCAYVFYGQIFAVWPDYVSGNVYVDMKAPPDIVPVALTKDDMTPNYLMIDRNSSYFKFPVQAFQCGQLYFDSEVTRELFLEMLGLLGLR